MSLTSKVTLTDLTGKFGNCTAEILKFNTKYIESIKIVCLIYRLRDTNFP